MGPAVVAEGPSHGAVTLALLQCGSGPPSGIKPASGASPPLRRISSLPRPGNTAFPPLENYEIDPSRTVLITLDLQYMVCHPDHGTGARAKEAGRAEAVKPYYDRIHNETVPAIAGVQRFFRDRGLPLIHIRIASVDPQGRDANLSYRMRNFVITVDSPDARWVEAVAPQPGELTLNKGSSSGFNTTNLNNVLLTMGADTIVLCGVMTNGCVEMTARDGADLGYKVIVLEDCCTSNNLEVHEATLNRLAAGLLVVNVRDSAGVQKEIAGKL